MSNVIDVPNKVPGFSARKLLFVAIVALGVLAALYAYTSIILRTSTEMMLTKFSFQIQNPTQVFYARIPYGDYILTYRQLPELTGVFADGATHPSDIQCRTIIERNDKVVLDTTKFNSTWQEDSHKRELVKITCQVSNPNKHTIFFTITPGF